MLSSLFQHEFELNSTDEVTSDGVAVYRIGYTEDRVQRWTSHLGYAVNFERN
jgi:hypothetical protein